MSVVIHNRQCCDSNTDALGIYVDSIDRGPKGEKGDVGEKGEKGEKGDTGIGIKRLFVNDSDHLIVKFSNNTEADVGEIPKILSKRVFSGIITDKIIPLSIDGKPVEIKKSNISFIIINGVFYSDGWDIRGSNLVLEIPDLPLGGKIEIFNNTYGITAEGSGAVTSVNGKVGDVEIVADFDEIDINDINNVCEE